MLGGTISAGEPGSLVGAGPTRQLRDDLRPSASMMLRLPVGSEWRREALRTNLWLVPMVEVIAAIGLYAITHVVNRAGYHRSISIPP